MAGINDFGKVEYNFNDFKNAVSENLGEELKGALNRNLSEVKSIFDFEAKNDGGKKDDLLEVNSSLLKDLVNKATLIILQNLKKEQNTESKPPQSIEEAMKNLKKSEDNMLREKRIEIEVELYETKKELQEKENVRRERKQQEENFDELLKKEVERQTDEIPKWGEF